MQATLLQFNEYGEERLTNTCNKINEIAHNHILNISDEIHL